jgi:hypothetical protein
MERFCIVRTENPELEPWMITLTVRNGDDLEERMTHLRNSWNTLNANRRQVNKRGSGSSSLANVEGAVFSFEVTKKGKGWHPHVHCFAMVSEPFVLDHKGRCPQLIEEWKRITGDSFIVDVRPITGDPAEAFVEVLKYAVKFSSLSIQDNWKAFLYLRGSRLLGSFGCFFGVEVPDDLADEPLEELPYTDMFFRYVSPSVGYNYEGSDIRDLSIQKDQAV